MTPIERAARALCEQEMIDALLDERERPRP